MGWASMNRYWQEMVAQSHSEPLVRSLLAPSALETPSKPSWQRYLQRYILYPLRVRSQVQSGILHLLDHSFAHLLPFVRPAVRTVVTVHDLIPLVEPGDLTAQQIARFSRTVHTLQRADRLVCVSEHTRDEVRRLLDVPAEKLVVNPMGAADLPEPDPAMAERLASLNGYLLSVGHNATRKNLAMLPAILGELAASGERLVLVRAGAFLEADLAVAIREHAELHELGFVSDAELAAAYAHATLLLLPSTHEGFGLPAIEAMDNGCPVVCSRSTSLPEVVGEAGLLFDPSSPAEAAQQCRILLQDANVKKEYIARGRDRAAVFTYRAHWEKLLTVYQSLHAP
jgi:glycosyltransferase involved in cell wall biosynthesis